VSKPNLPLVPADYVRKQTIAGGERFITPELKDLRGQGAAGGRAHPRARDAPLRGAARPRRRGGEAHPAEPSRAAAALDVLALQKLPKDPVILNPSDDNVLNVIKLEPGSTSRNFHVGTTRNIPGERPKVYPVVGGRDGVLSRLVNK